MSIAEVPESRVVLHNVSWSTFQSLAREATSGRLAYDQGTMEIMSPSYHHEFVKRAIGRMIEVYTEEMGIPLAPASSTTLSREELAKGIEADESYYITSAPRIFGKTQIDLTNDPPPDLVVEVDIPSSSLDKLAICRSIGIPEVWRFNRERLEVNLLGDDQQYHTSDHSRELPDFPLDEAARLLGDQGSFDETELAREFRLIVQDRRKSS